MSKNRKARVAAAVKAIEKFYSLGRSLPRKRTHGDGYGASAMLEEAKRLGVNEDTLRKARKFADHTEGYSDEELRTLCKMITLVQTVQHDDLAIITRSHVIRFLTVQKTRRATIQREAIENGWSIIELERQIAARFGTRRSGGRKKRVPRDVLSLLSQIEKMCEGWRRWQAAVTPDPKEPRPRHAILIDLSSRVRLSVHTAGTALAALQVVVIEELQGLRSSRVVRHHLRADGDEAHGRNQQGKSTAGGSRVARRRG